MSLTTDETLPLVSITEAARRMGVSRATAYRLVNRGELPALMVGGQLRIDPLELRDYIYGPAETAEPLTVVALMQVLGRDRAWINRVGMSGLPCSWNGRGEVVSVRREDLPAWQEAVKRESHA